jgi:hypothetical protein
MFRVDDEYLNGYSKLCGPNATMVYLCLCRHADRHQESFPSVKTMSEKTGISPRSVIRGIQTLIEWNIISKERERRSDATWLNNRYVLLDKSSWKPKPSATEACGQDASQVPNEAEPSATAGKSQVPQGHTKVSHKKDTHKKDIATHGVAGDDVFRHNALGAEVIKAFEEVDPKNKRYYGVHAQRDACDFLIDEYGLEEVLSRVKWLPKLNGQPYVPTITTPLQLRDKWVALQNAVGRLKTEKQRSRMGIIGLDD